MRRHTSTVADIRDMIDDAIRARFDAIRAAIIGRRRRCAAMLGVIDFSTPVAPAARLCYRHGLASPLMNTTVHAINFS